MKFTKLYFAVIGLLIVFGFQSCSNDGSSIDNETLIEGNGVFDGTIEGNNSRVQFKLVDAPGTYDNVFVNIVDVQYNSSEEEEGWRSFPEPEGGYPDQIDLCTLVAGDYYLLADVIIESEMLKQIRIVLGENNEVVEDGVRHKLTTPSAQQSGLKIKLDTELVPGFSYDFTLDWDVDKSIVKAGKSGKYILKPVIYASSTVNSGSISGNVVGKPTIDEDAVALEGVLVEVYAKGDPNEYITSSLTNDAGDFIIQGLDPEQSYVLKINHDGYEEYMTLDGNEIAIVAGEVTMLSESIELLLQKSIVGNVTGEVLGEDPIPLEGVTVNVFASSDTETLLFSAITDSDGNFFFRGLNTDTYILKIMHIGYENYMTPDGNEISVVAGETTVLDASIEMLLLKSIIGKVIDSDGDVVGAMIDVYSASDNTTSLGSYTSSSDGSFFFKGLVSGDYVLKIIGPDGDDEGTDSDYKEYNTPTGDPDETIVVNDGETTDVGNIEIEKL